MDPICTTTGRVFPRTSRSDFCFTPLSPGQNPRQMAERSKQFQRKQHPFINLQASWKEARGNCFKMHQQKFAFSWAAWWSVPHLIKFSGVSGKLTSCIHDVYIKHEVHMYLQAGLYRYSKHVPSSKGSTSTCLQNDCRGTGLLQETLSVTPHLLSSGLLARLLSALHSNPWPPVCAHPFPLLSLVLCWGLGSLQAWGASLLLPSHSHSLTHSLLGWRNEHIISLARCQREYTRGPCGLLAQSGGYDHSGVFPFLSSLHPGRTMLRV